jgi:hypothetical protein
MYKLTHADKHFFNVQVEIQRGARGGFMRHANIYHDFYSMDMNYYEENTDMIQIWKIQNSRDYNLT